MSPLPTPPRRWVVVLSRHQARILHDLRNRTDPEHVESQFEGPDRKLRDVLRDRPGRSYSSVGFRPSGMEPGSDALREDARGFLRDLFSHLERHRAEGAFDALTVIGAPDMLGLWRAEVPDALRDCVVQEHAKNLIALPEVEFLPAVRELVGP